eukprot:TRINITY_DN49451_c0_g1_i2.p1 TRINITY_DN49451_c0_g1~~TRINITY_DN49451_c0_g1_i2.p1  ORF type:complete len:543 (+),score=85.62 TRINITY_DN49451_c0_g1_i2:2-1630(+)
MNTAWEDLPGWRQGLRAAEAAFRNCTQLVRGRVWATAVDESSVDKSQPTKRLLWEKLGRPICLAVCAPRACSKQQVSEIAAPLVFGAYLTAKVEGANIATILEAVAGSNLALPALPLGFEAEELSSWSELQISWIIMGFPGTGTTTLASSLQRHPDLETLTQYPEDHACGLPTASDASCWEDSTLYDNVLDMDLGSVRTPGMYAPWPWASGATDTTQEEAPQDPPWGPPLQHSSQGRTLGTLSAYQPGATAIQMVYNTFLPTKARVLAFNKRGKKGPGTRAGVKHWIYVLGSRALSAMARFSYIPGLKAIVSFRDPVDQFERRYFKAVTACYEVLPGFQPPSLISCVYKATCVWDTCPAPFNVTSFFWDGGWAVSRRIRMAVSALGRENILLIGTEELSKRGRAVYDAIAKFLGVGPFPEGLNFTSITNKAYESPWTTSTIRKALLFNWQQRREHQNAIGSLVVSLNPERQSLKKLMQQLPSSDRTWGQLPLWTGPGLDQKLGRRRGEIYRQLAGGKNPKKRRRLNGATFRFLVMVSLLAWK